MWTRLGTNRDLGRYTTKEEIERVADDVITLLGETLERVRVPFVLQTHGGHKGLEKDSRGRKRTSDACGNT